MGPEQQITTLAHRLRTHILGLRARGDEKAAQAALERFGGFVADELRGAPEERTGRRLDTDPPPASSGGMSVTTGDSDPPDP